MELASIATSEDEALKGVIFAELWKVVGLFKELQYGVQKIHTYTAVIKNMVDTFSPNIPSPSIPESMQTPQSFHHVKVRLQSKSQMTTFKQAVEELDDATTRAFRNQLRDSWDYLLEFDNRCDMLMNNLQGSDLMRIAYEFWKRPADTEWLERIRPKILDFDRMFITWLLKIHNVLSEQLENSPAVWARYLIVANSFPDRVTDVENSWTALREAFDRDNLNEVDVDELVFNAAVIYNALFTNKSESLCTHLQSLQALVNHLAGLEGVSHLVEVNDWQEVRPRLDMEALEILTEILAYKDETMWGYEGQCYR